MKLGILGSGKIVVDLLSFVDEISNTELEAIGSTERSYQKTLDLKEKYGIKKAYRNADDLLKDSDVEVVYVGVPNFLHYEIVKKSLKAGKHVICEKPFTSNQDQLEELIAISKENNLILLEAISNLYLPNVKKLKDTLNKVGQIKIVNFNYSQYSSRYDAFKNGELAPVFDINKDGGALVDLNIYNIHLLVELFGLPKKVKYLANIEKNIDTSGILTLDYGKFKAIAIGAKDCSALINSIIQGDRGAIVIDSPPNEINSFDLLLNGKKVEKINIQEDKHRLYYEFLEFERIIRQKDFSLAYKKLERSLKVIKLMTRARKDAGILYPSDKKLGLKNQTN